MRADRVLVIDAGTSALRGVVVDRDGAARTIAREPWPVFVPEDAAPYGREFHAAEVMAAVERIGAAAAPEREQLAGIAVTGQREGIAFVDTAGQAIFASPNVDARASAEGIAIDAAHGGEVYAVTGHLPSLMQVPAKLAWLRVHRPQVAGRVARVLPLADWIAMLLTGRAAASLSLAAENGLIDVRTGVPAVALFEALGTPATNLPDVLDDGAVSGVAGAGVLKGRPVVLAGADTQCALAGLGIVEPGEAGVVAGWSAPVQLVTGAPVFDCEQRTWTGIHVAARRWILESNAGETGRAWDWACAMMGQKPEDACGLAAASPVGARDAMAVLGARAMHASQMTAGMGALTFPLPLVMSAPERGDLLRSVLEATAYAIRANVEQLELVSGAPIGRIAIGGGMARSELFVAIVASVLDRPVEVAVSFETSALGAAIVASAALGIERQTAPRPTVDPNVRDSLEYEDGYARWCALADQLERAGMEG